MGSAGWGGASGRSESWSAAKPSTARSVRPDLRRDLRTGGRAGLRRDVAQSSPDPPQRLHDPAVEVSLHHRDPRALRAQAAPTTPRSPAILEPCLRLAPGPRAGWPSAASPRSTPAATPLPLGWASQAADGEPGKEGWTPVLWPLASRTPARPRQGTVATREPAHWGLAECGAGRGERGPRNPPEQAPQQGLGVATLGRWFVGWGAKLRRRKCLRVA